MEETVVRPSIFVVDGQIDIPFRRLGCSRRRQPCSAAQLGLGLMLLLVVAGLAVQGWFLLQLHWRLEAVGTPLQDKGAKPWEQLLQERKPQQAKTVALLTGANFSWTGSGGPVLSETKLGLAFLRGLSYRDRALVVAQAGYYYIYSKVQLGGKSCSQGLTGDCLPITHVLYRHMPCFPEEVELLVNQWSPGRQAGSSQVWWDSTFLGGVVHLNMGEEVVVCILSEHVIRLHDGTRSYFRAFMV